MRILGGVVLAAVTFASAGLVSISAPAVGDGSDPIVVDNPRISVSRANGRSVQQEADHRWSLGDMDGFHKLVVTTTFDGTTATIQKPLFGHDRLRFALVAFAQPAPASFSLFLAPGGQQPKVMVESQHDQLRFEIDDPQNPAKIADRTDVLHIGQIQIGSSYVCIADTGRPRDGRCENWQTLPDSVQILVCANDSCTVTAH
jgi:hypothetical protein